jgi:hypothetical protein
MVGGDERILLVHAADENADPPGLSLLNRIQAASGVACRLDGATPFQEQPLLGSMLRASFGEMLKNSASNLSTSLMKPPHLLRLR